MGESIISVSTSHIKFTPLCKSLSPKRKQEKFSKSPNLVYSVLPMTTDPKPSNTAVDGSSTNIKNHGSPPITSQC